MTYWTQSFGLRTRGVSGNKYWQTAAECVATGFPTPEEIYHPGEPASGNIVGKLGIGTWTPEVSPHYQQPFDGAQLGNTLDQGTGDRFLATANSQHNYGNDSFAFLIAYRLTEAPGGARSLITKGSIGSTPGYEILVTNDRVYWIYRGDVGAAKTPFVLRVPDTDRHYWIVGYNQTLTTAYLYGDIGNVSLAGAIGSTDVASPFIYGLARTACPPSNLGFLTSWRGAGAETVLTNRATLGPAWDAL